ncbi:NADPH-dependent F420 reductase [Gluconacetobacter takamatsuzukensis]|uniref:NADPH-dependent F420 reductase n=1 Tax=Gluconacetobacter takamatsuzukensis TaxID=1286190 RepID=A0A7W4KCE1_9PROT|nr:NADPH-dependent F420 reductase [Gluconacetobacter takamatsuzukensis]MBB2204361.1 NADPH-dependent F420 reductase [Gluconacetobacter takamatsuzukensis]
MNRPLRRRTLLAGLCALLPARLALAAQPLRIGTIGAGHVGSTLAGLWLRAGYPVMLSASDIGSARAAAETLGGNAQAGTPQDAARFGDVVLLAVPYGALPAVGASLHGLLAGKIVIDACNPYPWRDGSVARTARQQGAGLVTQSFFPGAHVVRAFNSEDMSTIAAEAHRAPPLLGIPYAGDDPAAMRTVGTLIAEAGFDPVAVGPLASARLFQPGSDGFEASLTAPDLRARLGLPRT